VPENSEVDLATGFNHIKDLASLNRLKINTDKAKEINPEPSISIMPAPLDYNDLYNIKQMRI